MSDQTSVAAELAAYAENHFHPERLAAPLLLPLDPEPHVAVWREYADRVAAAESIEPLRQALVQLQFPIREGISQEETYRSATRRGAEPALSEEPVQIRGRVSVVIHDHPAGPVPAIVTADRSDFVALARALAAKNEPISVPASQGACVVSGLNNWDRIRRYRRDWEQASGGGEAEWAAELQRIIPEKSRYQDRFLIVSDGPYSGVAAADVGCTSDEWRAKSVALRLEHEAAHYFTKRVFGSMQNRLHDELLADWAAIRAANGSYRADWFLRFLGVENFPVYREGGRLQNYCDTPEKLSGEAVAVLRGLIVNAAVNLERFERGRNARADDPRALATGLIALASVSLIDIAADDGPEQLERAHRRAVDVMRWR